MKTVYYFGAGASAKAIPTITGLTEGLNAFKLLLIEFSNKELSGLDPRIEVFQPDLARLIKIYEKLIFESKWHQTIDTLARKYYLTDDWESYEDLKIGLAVYFLYCQFFESKSQPPFNSALNSTHNTNLDKRYDSLFAAILNKNNKNEIEIKQNISIITWNYDLQIELALYNYENSTINNIKEKYNILPNRESLDELEIAKHIGFKVFKLNGNAFLDLGHATSEKVTIFDTLLKKINNEKFLKFDFFLGELLEKIALVKRFSKGNDSTFLRYFNFSWEKPNDSTRCYLAKNQLFNYAQSTIQETNCLIIVGYSFPDFNWEADRFILEKSQLKKIVIQDYDPDKIENRLLELIPQLKDPLTKDNTKLEIIKMTPGDYFPTNV